MEVYNETKKLINKISDDVVVMRISSNHKHNEEYEQGLDALTINYQMLQTKKTEISDELERLFFEDESKFDRVISLWFKELDFNIIYVMTINQQIPSNFIIDSFARYRSWNLMEKRLKSGDRKLTIDMDIFLSYLHWILYDIKETIKQRQSELKKAYKQLTDSESTSSEANEINKSVKKEKQKDIIHNESPKFELSNFINNSILPLFIAAEKKALGDSISFNSKIRCAAFCEILYEKKYLIQGKYNQKIMRDFALGRYKLNIKVSLLDGNINEREKHKKQTVMRMPPLKNCF